MSNDKFKLYRATLAKEFPGFSLAKFKPKMSGNKLSDKTFPDYFLEFKLEDLVRGIQIEIDEHSTDTYTAAEIALAHLSEHADYYDKDHGLSHFEKTLKETYELLRMF